MEQRNKLSLKIWMRKKYQNDTQIKQMILKINQILKKKKKKNLMKRQQIVKFYHFFVYIFFYDYTMLFLAYHFFHNIHIQILLVNVH